MMKIILYFSLVVCILANSSYANSGPLLDANREYMQRMQGSHGILDKKGTNEQLRHMIDGCITAGITDRLYGLAQAMQGTEGLTPSKKLHIQLAYAFYALGYYDCNNDRDIKSHLGTAIDSNFDKEFSDLCTLVFDKGTIYQYKANLEDVIKRTAHGLRFDDFVEEDFYPSDTEEGNRTLGSAYYPYKGVKVAHPEFSPSQVAEKMRELGHGDFKNRYVKKGTAKKVAPSPSTAALSLSTTSNPVSSDEASSASQGFAENALEKVGFPTKQAFLAAGGTEENFGKLAKMLKVGMPAEAVKNKMLQEGVTVP